MANGFTLDAVGSQGIPFTFSGTYVLADDGGLALTVGGQTWMGAVDQDYHTVVLIDNFVEAPVGTNVPELNIFLGLRVVPPPP